MGVGTSWPVGWPGHMSTDKAQLHTTTDTLSSAWVEVPDTSPRIAERVEALEKKVLTLDLATDGIEALLKERDDAKRLRERLRFLEAERERLVEQNDSLKREVKTLNESGTVWRAHERDGVIEGLRIKLEQSMRDTLRLSQASLQSLKDADKPPNSMRTWDVLSRAGRWPDTKEREERQELRAAIKAHDLMHDVPSLQPTKSKEWALKLKEEERRQNAKPPMIGRDRPTWSHCSPVVDHDAPCDYDEPD